MTVLVLASGAAWLWLTLGHGRFWRSGPVLGKSRTHRPLAVAVVIAARNEAEHIGETLRSLLAQEVSGELRVVMVDDNSTDETAAIAQRLAGADERLRVVAGARLPHGWTGKMWAVSQGLMQPEVLAAEYVLLTDADIVHEVGHLAALLGHVEARELGLVSEMVRLRCETFAERATLPAFVFFFQMLYPFAWVNDPGKRTAAAAGGTILISQAALRSVEGVSRIRAALIDDVALARQIKDAGYGIWLGHGERVRSERRYQSLGEVWAMIARTAYVQLGYSPWMLLGACVGMVLLYGVPVTAALRGKGAVRWLGATGWAGMALAFQPTLRRYRQSPLWGMALPAIGAFYLLATVGSAIRFYRGNGGGWKGRTYELKG